MLYLFQITAYTGLFVLIYILLLRNKSVHAFNRAYLLFIAIAPAILPFIALPGMQQQVQAINMLNIQLPEYTVVSGQVVNSNPDLFWAFYMVISASIALWAIWNWIRLSRFIKKHGPVEKDGYALVADTGYGPGSWRRYIILPGNNTNESVIAHELAHIKLHHSRDIIFLTALQVFLWPNVFLVWIRKELLQVHEFQADASVAGDKQAYARLLLSGLFGTCTLSQTHSFIIHPIKRRIMMLKKNNGKAARTATFLLTAAAVGFVMVNIIGLQSCKQKNWEVKQATNAETTKPASAQVLKLADKMPEYPGGQKAMMEYMAQNMEYPKEAIEKKIEGRVVVQFAVGDDGTIKEPEVVKSPDAMLSDAALQLVKNMPKWIPGENNGEKVCVRYTLPVMFKL